MAPSNNTNNSNKKRRNRNRSRPRKKIIPLVGRCHDDKNNNNTVVVKTMTSRKHARKVTTMFHKLTKQRDIAISNGQVDEIEHCDLELKKIGGREAYQRASQLSTSYHSTSKWVLGQLKSNGWLYGIKQQQQQHSEEEEDDEEKEETEDIEEKGIDDDDDSKNKNDLQQHQKKMKKKKVKRRNTRLLEVGAINTELLDAAAELKHNNNNDNDDDTQSTTTTTTHNKEKKYKLDVRAIDINSMHPSKIEEMDFLKLPYLSSTTNIQNRYDVIVCSMVINCVTTSQDRGLMLMKLYDHLRPGGLCFFTLPLFCLTKSAFLTYDIFKDMLQREGGIGFEIINTKNSPRIAFFVLRRPISTITTATTESKDSKKINPIYKKQIIRNKGKKFPNQFSVVLP